MSNSVPVKICYILPVYNPAAGSHFFHLYELIRRASDSGELDLFLVVERASGNPAELGVPFHVQKFSFAPLRFLELTAVLLRERLRGRKRFYTHYSFYGALGSLLVTRLLGGRAYYWNSGEPWKYRRSRFEEEVFRFILRRVFLVTNPPSLAAEYQKRYGLRSERVRILPHFINVSRFRPDSGFNYDRNYIREKLKIPPEAKVILFVHRLSRRKGAHLIPGIASGVTRSRRDVIFVIVGDGPEYESLKLKVKSLKLEPYVRLVDAVAQKDIVPYFRAADVLLLPSEEEGFPHVLLEAAAAGLPYVAGDVGGVREMTPPLLRQFIMPSGDIAGFAAKISALLSKPPPELKEIIDAEKEWVKSFDFQAVLPAFVKLFEF